MHVIAGCGIILELHNAQVHRKSRFVLPPLCTRQEGASDLHSSTPTGHGVPRTPQGAACSWRWWSVPCPAGQVPGAVPGSWGAGGSWLSPVDARTQRGSVPTLFHPLRTQRFPFHTPLAPPCPAAPAHPVPVGMLSISLIFQTFNFMVFSELTPSLAAPGPHRGTACAASAAAWPLPRHRAALWAGKRREEDEPGWVCCPPCPRAVGSAHQALVPQPQAWPAPPPEVGPGGPPQAWAQLAPEPAC